MDTGGTRLSRTEREKAKKRRKSPYRTKTDGNRTRKGQKKDRKGTEKADAMIGRDGVKNKDSLIVVLPTVTRTVTAERREFGLAEKYITALTSLGLEPLLIPPGLSAAAWGRVLSFADGVCLSGGASHLHPIHYGGHDREPAVGHARGAAPAAHDERDDPDSNGAVTRDEARDHFVLPFIRAVLARDMPMLAICRGLQEVNVAAGGTLGFVRASHRPPHHPYHPVHVVEGGLLSQWIGGGIGEGIDGGPGEERGGDSNPIVVNSFHAQAIERLAPSLRVEARASDGTIEAISGRCASFLVGVQWHPEYPESRQSSINQILWTHFREAVRRFALAKAARG